MFRKETVQLSQMILLGSGQIQASYVSKNILHYWESNIFKPSKNQVRLK